MDAQNRMSRARRDSIFYSQSTLASGARYSAQVNGDTFGTSFDRTIVTGTVAIGGAQLVLSGTRVIHDGSPLVLIQNDGTDAVSGTFANLDEGVAVFSTVSSITSLTPTTPKSVNRPPATMSLYSTIRHWAVTVPFSLMTLDKTFGPSPRTLQHLTQSGMLESTGGRGAVYHLPGEAIPTPDDVFGPTPRISVPSYPNLTDNRDGDGRLVADQLPLSIMDDLGVLSLTLRQRLEAMAIEPRRKGRNSAPSSSSRCDASPHS